MGAGRRARVRALGMLVTTTVAVALTASAGVSAAQPPPPPGGVDLAPAAPVPASVRALLQRVPAVRATPLDGWGPGQVVVWRISDDGVIVGEEDSVAVRWVDGVVQRADRPPAGAPAGAVGYYAAANAHGDVAVNLGDGGGPALWHRDGTLEPLPFDGVWAEARAMGDDGTVGGVVQSDAHATYRAVLWRDGAAVDVGARGWSSVTHVNARGVAVGVMDGPFGQQSWQWRDGRLTPLPLPPGAGLSGAYLVTGRGDVLGQVGAPGIEDVGSNAVWFGGRDLRYLRGHVVLHDLDERGVAVGRVLRPGAADDDVVRGHDAVVMTRLGAVRLPTTEGGDAIAKATNGRGVVVGAQMRAGRREAVAWVLGVPVPLLDPPGVAGVVRSAAQDVDAHGRVVGLVEVTGTHGELQAVPVVWDVGSVVRQLGRLLR